MTNKVVSRDLKMAISRLGKDMPVAQVAAYCDVSGQTVRNILKRVEETGSVDKEEIGAVLGRPKTLSDQDLKV
jgi:transposase